MYVKPNSNHHVRLDMEHHENRAHFHTETACGKSIHLEVAKEYCSDGYDVHAVRATLTSDDECPVGYASFGLLCPNDGTDGNLDVMIELLNKYDERFSSFTPIVLPTHTVDALPTGRLLFGYHIEIAVENRGKGLGIAFLLACLAELKTQFPDIRSFLYQTWPIQYIDVLPNAMPRAVRDECRDDIHRLMGYLLSHNESFGQALLDDTGVAVSAPLLPQDFELAMELFSCGLEYARNAVRDSEADIDRSPGDTTLH
jgi:hypothetical protein